LGSMITLVSHPDSSACMHIYIRYRNLEHPVATAAFIMEQRHIYIYKSERLWSLFPSLAYVSKYKTIEVTESKKLASSLHLIYVTFDLKHIYPCDGSNCKTPSINLHLGLRNLLIDLQ
jgi:hypothetical protein